MTKLYQYTILYQDGTKDVLPPCPKKGFDGSDGLYKLLDCNTIELIPTMYYRGKGWGKCYVFGDEEGRFNSENHTNPHFDSFTDDEGTLWDVVGNCVKEEIYHEAQA